MSDKDTMRGGPSPLGPLYKEHLALGAAFERGVGGRLFPMAYEGEPSVAEGTPHLCDLAGSAYLLVCGPTAQEFVEMAFCGRRLAVGECAFEATLMGDGALASVALVARTGAQEYVLLDASERGELLAGWLGFLQGVEQGGQAPFAEVELSQADALLHPLLLWGPGSLDVLCDYVASRDLLPAAGHVADLDLDRIHTVCMGVPGPAEAHVALVPPDRAATLWRSLLSFTQVVPVGRRSLREALAAAYPWGQLLAMGQRLEPTEQTLRKLGLLRTDGGFVGARAIGRG